MATLEWKYCSNRHKNHHTFSPDVAASQNHSKLLKEKIDLQPVVLIAKSPENSFSRKVKIDPKMSLRFIIKKGVKQKIKVNFDYAARFIQRVYRGYWVRKVTNVLKAKRNQAASKLQKAWKRYRIFNLIPKALRYRKNKAVSIIQKYLRGYWDYTIYNRIMKHNKMNNSFKYFSKLRNAVLARCQVKIAAAWRWKKVLERIKERESNRK